MLLKLLFLKATFSYYTSVTFSMTVSDLWLQLELASVLESDVRDTGAGSGLFIMMLGKLTFFVLPFW